MAAGGIVLPLAGCTEESTEEAEGSVNGEDSDNNDSEGSSDSGSDDSGSNGGSGGGGSSGLEIVDHEFYQEEFQAGVRGTVANNTGETLDYIEVKVKFYDSDGTQIDDSLDNTEDLDAGVEWAFDAILLQAEAEQVSDYDIEVSDSPF